jgi:hypothetical protein
VISPNLAPGGYLNRSVCVPVRSKITCSPRHGKSKDNPVRYGIPVDPEVSDQNMISMFPIKRLLVNQVRDDGLDRFRLAATLDHEFQVFAKRLV